MTARRILPAAAPLAGAVRVPGDKSIAHRAFLLSSLAAGTSTIVGAPDGEDVRATRRAVASLGAGVTPADGEERVDGAGLELGAGSTLEIDCANSGTTMRLVAGLVAARAGTVRLTGDASLSRRPMERVARPLRAMGADVCTHDGHAPIVVRGGRLHPITWTLEVASAQVKSAILLAGLRTDGTTAITEPIPTRDHTERLLAYLGARIERGGRRCAVTGQAPLRASVIPIPADPSSAAFWVVAASIVPGSRVTLPDVCVNETRLGLVRILRRMGADIRVVDPAERAGEPCGSIEVRAAPLRGTVVPPEEVPAAIDELPLLAVAAACAAGETVVRGAAELRAKESDRLAAIGQLAALGADVRVAPDGFAVRGRPAAPLAGGRVNAQGDHRVAMALAVAALVSRAGIVVDGADVVSVSYPTFFADLERLGGTSTPCPDA